LTKPMESDVRFDLALSDLVFHNMGKKRFKAYGAVFDALKPRGYFVIGDYRRFVPAWQSRYGLLP